MDVCVLLFCGLATGSSPVQGVLPTAYKIKKLKRRKDPKSCRAIEREGEKFVEEVR
jgi:hypothetical protein